MPQRYKDFKPTQFDAPGLNGGRYNISEWFVLLSKTRDADSLEESNFEVCKKMLTDRFGPEYEPEDSWAPCSKLHEWDGMLPPLEDIVGSNTTNWYSASFGHWACGDFELLLVEDTIEGEDFAEEIISSLQDYPILDEDDWSTREHDRAWDYFSNTQYHDMIRSVISDFEDMCPRICNLVESLTEDDIWEIVGDSNWHIQEVGYEFDDNALNIHNVTKYVWDNRKVIRSRNETV